MIFTFTVAVNVRVSEVDAARVTVKAVFTCTRISTVCGRRDGTDAVFALCVFLCPPL